MWRKTSFSQALQVACLLILFFFFQLPGNAQDHTPFRDVVIEPPFDRALRENADFMGEGGARLFAGDNDELILIGIGKVFPEQNQRDNEQRMRRAGEIQARVALLELGGDIEISAIRKKNEGLNAKGLRGEKMSISSFFQVTKSSVREKIQQLPIIGSWRSNNRDIFYIAVGKVIDGDDGKKDIKSVHSDETPRDIPLISGSEPFASLLRISPVLLKNGGVRGFVTEDGRRALLAVASAKHLGSFAKVRRTAQLFALRALLGHRQGIELSSVESLTDSEQIRLSKNQEKRISISRFTSIQEEQVSGMVRAMPIVATWKDEDSGLFYVAIGRVFDR